VNNYKDAISPTFAPKRRLRTGLLSALPLLLAGLLIAGCGSSGESSTITIGNESKANSKLITSSPESSAPKTPTSGPLATKPTVEAGKGPAPTKLETKDLVTGTGAEAKKGSTVYVNYVGVLWKNGEEFDSSWKRNEPFTFGIGTGQVIKGWDKGVPGMKVGGRRELRIPAEEAYGKLGSPPKIPKNEALIFVIDLLKA
jgi:FKBP-type peptidyl-prolyl cis-trans isomerase